MGDLFRALESGSAAEVEAAKLAHVDFVARLLTEIERLYEELAIVGGRASLSLN